MEPPEPTPPREYTVLVSEEPAANEGGKATGPLSDEPSVPNRGGRRTALLRVGAVVGAMLAVVGVALWWALWRPVTEPPVTELPGDTVALINSTATVTPRLRASATDAPPAWDAPPRSEEWSEPLRSAYRSLEEGRYPAATSQFAALVGSARPGAEREALWGLAEAYAAAGQGELAVRAYSIFAGLDDPRAPRALYRAALLLEESGSSVEAGRLYEEYARHAGPARHAVMLRRARLMGPVEGAEDLYEAVLDGDPLDVDRREALAGLADARSRRGDHSGARDAYDRLAELQTGSPRPVLDRLGTPPQVLAAEEARLAGDTAGVRKRLLDYIPTALRAETEPGGVEPHHYGAHLAVEALLKLEPSAVVSGTVAPLVAARAAFESGFYSRAFSHLDAVRAGSPDPAALAEASLLSGRALAAGGDSVQALDWFTRTVQTYPRSRQAPEAARRSGDMLVSQELWDPALLVYRGAAARFPGAGEETARTRINGGVLAYRLEQREVALELLRPVITGTFASPALRAEAAFWAGKVEKGTGGPAWRETISQTVTLAPGTYLGFRAQSLLEGEPPGGPVMPSFAEAGIEEGELGTSYTGEASERAALLEWAEGLTITPTSRVEIARLDQERGRAALLLEAGDSRAGISARALVEALLMRGDAAEAARLLLFMRYHPRSDPRHSMRVGDMLAARAGGSPLLTPRLLLKTIYPAPYGRLVVAEAQERDVDPLAVYALIRQESQFVPDARSRADARGLTQVIPSTGGGIAADLNDAGYSLEQLYLPHVSLRYGTYYLSSNMPQFERKLLPVLAAYNGGPGNAARWLAGSALLDPDLYLERVDLFETEDYLRKVYTNYGFYRLAYEDR